MNGSPNRRLFVEMLREEWRLHSRLFSGRRFAAFPLFVLLLVAGTTQLLLITGQQRETVLAGIHALVFVFGLHTGSIGFVGRDAIRNLLGDLTLLVFAARTLPVSQRRLFGIFLVKDVVYYALLFLLPMAIGVWVPGMVGVSAGGAVVFRGTVPGMTATAFVFWVSLAGTFVLGLGTTIAALGVSNRRWLGAAVGSALGAAIILAWSQGVDPLAVTPYGLFESPSLERLVGTLALLVGVYGIGAVTFDVSAGRSTRTAGPAFGRWQRRVGDPLATKTLLDLHRSSGGFGKVVFSGAILLGVTAALVDLAGQITGVAPSVGVSFGAILGLTGFTTYNWLTQFDDVDAYRQHPVDVDAVFAAKFRAFLVLGPVVGLAFYALALGWLGGSLGEALVGAVLLVGVASYIFGVTVALTGLSPNEFLFDTALFAVFGLAVMLPLVPVLIVGFALAPVGAQLLVGLAGTGVALGSIGVVLYRRSLPRWTAHHRS